MYVDYPDVLRQHHQQPGVYGRPDKDTCSGAVAMQKKGDAVPLPDVQAHAALFGERAELFIMPGIAACLQGNAAASGVPQRHLAARAQVEQPFREAALRLKAYPAQQPAEKTQKIHTNPIPFRRLPPKT